MKEQEGMARTEFPVQIELSGQVGWHHRLDVYEYEQALGVGDGQGSLACCSLWGHKELGMTEQLN